MGFGHRIALGAATAVMIGGMLMGAGGAGAQPKPPALNPRREYYRATWTWFGPLKQTADPRNTSQIQFSTNTRAIYCYNDTCHEVTLDRIASGILSFSTDGKNRVELTTRTPTRIDSRFWEEFAPDRKADAIATFVLKP